MDWATEPHEVALIDGRAIAEYIQINFKAATSTGRHHLGSRGGLQVLQKFSNSLDAPEPRSVPVKNHLFVKMCRSLNVVESPS